MKLRLEYEDNNLWKVIEKYEWHSKRLDRWLVIPPGFLTDLASIPRLFLPIVDDDELAEAGTIHDHLYRQPTLYRGVTRRQMDRVMVDKMKEDGVSWWKRRLVYVGLRLGGGKAWRKNR